MFYVALLVFAYWSKYGEAEFFFVDQMRDLVLEEEFLSTDTHIMKNFHDGKIVSASRCRRITSIPYSFC